MKSMILALVFAFTGAAFARNISHEVVITKGPFFVPVTSEAFNPLGTDFKSEGTAVFYMTNMKFNTEFPRVNLFTQAATQDEKAPEYYFTKSNTGPKIRVGFEDEKLSWFFARSKDWTISISKKAGREHVAYTPFFKMTNDQIEEFAQRAFEETQSGMLDGIKVQRNGNLIVVTADVTQMGENDDDPTKVGEAVLSFHDEREVRRIVIKAQVEDLK